MIHLLNSAPVGILALDQDGRVTLINTKAEKVLGLGPDQGAGRLLADLVSDPVLLKILSEGAPESGLSHNYQGKPLIVRSAPLEDPAQPGGRVILLQDSGALRKQCEEAEQLRDEVSSLLENSYDGIVVADNERIIDVNSSFGRITGVPPSSLINKKLKDLDTNRHICLAAVQEVVRTTLHHKRSMTLQRRIKSGNEIFLTGNPVFNHLNQVSRVMVNIRDITELKRLQNQIKRLSLLCGDQAGEDQERPEAMQGVVAESPVMLRLLDLVVRVASVDSIVLLQGESGVGKDVLARLIHRLSRRSDEIFVSVNCGAIPETLLESEFFGYEKGAFTSASRNGKPGLFEQANHGTLFLDEVGELPVNLQVKLLKVIQDQRFRRLGGVKTLDVDLRIVAATNRDLRGMVRNGSFREDLFYRLYVVPIEIPPLRERREDILPLALKFLNQFNHKYGVQRTLDHTLMGILESYSWPGNVRELGNVIERMVVTADGENLHPRHLPASILEQYNEGETLWKGNTMNLKRAREALERQLIENALSRTGNTRKAAKLLGVDHSTVVRKAGKLGLSLRQDLSKIDKAVSR